MIKLKFNSEISCMSNYFIYLFHHVLLMKKKWLNGIHHMVKSESESTVAMHIVYELSRYIIFISLIRSSKYFF